MAHEIQGTPKNVIPKTLSESVYNNLRIGIINNEFKAGQRIYEKEVAKSFGVSTTPVREAFLRLSAEGFITIVEDNFTILSEQPSPTDIMIEMTPP